MATSTSGFVFMSTVSGAAIGGTIAGLGYNALGLGSFNEGFKAGAIVGGVAGFAGAMAYTGPLSGAQETSKGVCLGLPGRSIYKCSDLGSFGSPNDGFWQFDSPLMDGNYFFHFYETSPMDFVAPIIPGAKYFEENSSIIYVINFNSNCKRREV